MEILLKAIRGGIAAIAGTVIYWLGGLDSLLTALIIVIVLDYFTGILKGIHNKCLSSEIGFKGITKKVMSLTIVALAFVIENLTSSAFPLREIVIIFFIASEGISILENAGQIGVPFPPKLKKILIQLIGKDEE